MDISSNTALTELYCQNNLLVAVSLAGNTALKVVNASGNKLGTVSTTANKNLTSLKVNNCGLSTLDVSASVSLETLECAENKLRTIDVSKNTKLATLIADDNNLYALNCGFKIEDFSAENNNFKITLDETDSYDLTELTALKVANVTDLKNATITGSKLTYTGNNRIVTYNYKINDTQSMLVTINVVVTSKGLPIDEETFTDKAFLEYVKTVIDTDQDGYLSKEEIAAVTSIDVSGGVTIEGDTTKTKISSLTGIETFTNITELNCSDNKLTNIDVSTLTKLESLDVSNNNITELNLNGLSNLDDLKCDGNRITSIECDHTIANFSGTDNERNVMFDEDNSYDISKLGEVKEDQITNVEGAVIENGNFVWDGESEKITYEYEIGPGMVIKVVLVVNEDDTRIPSSSLYFPDISFREFLIARYDQNGDGKLSKAETIRF